MGNDTLHNVGKKEIEWYNNPVPTILEIFKEIGKTCSLGNYTTEQVINQLYTIQDLIEVQNAQYEVGLSADYEITMENIQSIVSSMEKFFKGKENNDSDDMNVLRKIVNDLKVIKLVYKKRTPEYA